MSLVDLQKECDGYGCVPADFMFVGISAGRLGALVTTVPFTKDASGRIFQRCLNRLALSKSDEFSLKPELENCYITNLVKSRVLTKEGLNRLPTMREMMDWCPYFLKEAKQVTPKKLFALGSLVYSFLRRNTEVVPLFLRHPRWYQSHGALNPESHAFAEMVMDYRKGVFGIE